MKWYAKILLWPILAVNIAVAMLLIGCAYSPMLPVADMPLLSLAGLAMPFVLAANLLFFFVWLILHRPFMMLPFLTCVICLPQIRTFSPINFKYQQAPDNSIKVVSYNILSSNLTAASANRENPLVTYLESSDADIICLQEFPFAAIKNGKKDAKKLFADYPYKSYDLSTDSELSAHYLGCLSKYPILSVEKIDLGTSTSNGCTKYRIKHGNDTIVVYNGHLQSNGLNDNNKSTYEQILTNPKENIKGEGTKELVKKLRDAAVKRAAQIDIIIADMEKETSPHIIVCGDLNDSPISYTCKALSKTLTNAYTASGNGPGFSYNRNKLFYRIDHIFHSPAFKSYACKVDRSIKLSDHYPIACHLEKVK